MAVRAAGLRDRASARAHGPPSAVPDDFRFSRRLSATSQTQSPAFAPGFFLFGSVHQRNDRGLDAIADETLEGLQIGARTGGMRLDAGQASRSAAGRTGWPTGE